MLEQPILLQDDLSIAAFSGPNARIFCADMARLRIEMFREFPYLYEGKPEDEARYLDMYFTCPDARILIAKHKERVIGFSSSIPLEQESPDFLRPFTEQGLDPTDYLYCGEALLEPQYRGRGTLRIYLEFHEQWADTLGRSWTTLMTVDRNSDHPMKSHSTTPIATYLKHFGYSPCPGGKIEASWKQVDTGNTERNSLTLWSKSIAKQNKKDEQ